MPGHIAPSRRASVLGTTFALLVAVVVICPGTPPPAASSGLPVVTVGNATAIEGNSGGDKTVVTFVAELDRALPADEFAIVEYETESGQATFGAATQGVDFEAARGTIAFADGATSVKFTVSIAEDTVPEFDETFRLQLEHPDDTQTNVVLAATEVTGTISNDDGIALTIPDTSAPEGSSGTRTVNVTVSLSAPAPSEISFDWKASSGGPDPASGSDFAGSGQGRIPQGAWETTLPVTLKGDTTVESNETFLIKLTNLSGGPLTSADQQAIVTITNDDGTTVSASSVTVQEGNEGTTLATTKVSLSSAAASDVIVSYETLAVTAGTDDFAPTKSTVTIPAGSTSAYVSVPVYSDTAIESSQYFHLALTGATGATVYTPTAQVNILDDDGIRIGAAEPVGEPDKDDEGYVVVKFPVTVSPPPSSDFTVAFETEQSSADPSDYNQTESTTTCKTNGTCSDISIAVKADDSVEGDESFLVEIYAANGTPYGIIKTDEAKGTISANDGIRVSDLSIIEGASAATTDAAFTVTMNPAPAQDVYVNFHTGDSSARAGGDYAAVQSGAVRIPANSTSGTGLVKVTGDNTVEGDERFFVKLDGASSGSIADDSGTLRILNDDGLIVTDVTVWEDEATARFTVSVWPAPSSSASFAYATAAQSATGGTSGARDFTTTSGSKSIPAGSTSVTIEVPLVDDDSDEADQETFLLELTGVTGTAPADTQAIATIKDYEI